MLIGFLYYYIFAFNEGYYLSITSENDLLRNILSYIFQLIFYILWVQSIILLIIVQFFNHFSKRVLFV